ncbi:MAG: MFS transporter [Xanthomonadaceae bacterium]|jgi:PAT family beta-lactamase induction signal transducer AmpG|nr:MFS transporter [Xanthomonadaceae bacterium]
MSHPPSFAAVHRLAVVMVLGFASGLPLALVGGAMQAWLTIEGIDIATIGFFALVGVPYTFKYLWAPLIDRFEPPLLGRRRGWIVLMQLLLAAALWGMAQLSPSLQVQAFAAIAVGVALLSATQDIAIDAYRTELLRPAERGLGGSLTVLGYRLAMVLSGGISLIWAQQWGSWPAVYEVMALIMLGAALFSALALPALAPLPPRELAGPTRELLGFIALLAGVYVGVRLAGLLLGAAGVDPGADERWERLGLLVAQIAGALSLGLLAARRGDLGGVLLGLAVGDLVLRPFGGLAAQPALALLLLPALAWAGWHLLAPRARFETLTVSLASYFGQPGAWAFLAMIVLYKVGDAYAMSLGTPFLMAGMGFGQAEVGIANKSIGLLATIVGAMLGGLIMLRVSLYHALLGFGVLQLVSNLGYWALAHFGAGALGVTTLPTFDLLIVSLEEPTPLDSLLLLAIGIDNVSGGMGTAALVALLMGLCNARFSATHYALLSAFAALGRVFVGPLAGVLAAEIGWAGFFLSSLLVAAPGVWMVWWMRREIDALGTPSTVAKA